MKTKTFNFSTRLVAAVLIALTSLAVTSCSKDDDDVDPVKTGFDKALIGSWIQEAITRDGTVSTKEYDFWDDGSGSYSYSHGADAEFKWTITSPNLISYKIWYYWDGRYSHKDSGGWFYLIRGDTLILEHDRYIKKRYGK